MSAQRVSEMTSTPVRGHLRDEYCIRTLNGSCGAGFSFFLAARSISALGMLCGMPLRGFGGVFASPVHPLGEMAQHQGESNYWRFTPEYLLF